jgi:hypothetical protein
MSLSSEVEVYQLRVYLRKVSPMIWRRVLVRSDSTIADLHYTLQIVMNWDDYHLHHFLIRNKRYGIAQIGAFGFMDDAYQVRLDRFHFRAGEKFVYTYNYYDDWQLEIRLEERLPLDFQKNYPLCVGGKRAAPLDDDGGPWRFMEFRQKYSVWEISERLLEIFDDKDLAENRDYYMGEVSNYYRWLNLDRFDRREINQRLQTIDHEEEDAWE